MTTDAIKRIHVLSGGVRVESVILPIRGRTTLCVSSQAGCRMGCAFCATGAMGFVRDLTAAEILAQAEDARGCGHAVGNIVFMGMGEPLDNLPAVAEAIRVLADPRGWNIPCRRITVSTAGHVDGLRALGELRLPNLRLAVSLNAADDALRDRLMPLNRRYPLKALKEALRAFPLGKRGVVLVEYVLLAGVNDSREQARQAARFLDGLPVRVNVIPYNGGSAPVFVTPSPERVREFGSWLMQEGLFVRTRLSRGAEVAAGCGQLKNSG
jgi:23S rRNA (adenine2503-C2)-methyltransferase